AFVAEHHGLAVDDCLAHTELLSSLGDRGKLVGPVEAFARVDGDIAGTDVKLGAVAVPLNLVPPSVARRRDFAQNRIAGLHIARHGRGSRPGRRPRCRLLQRYSTHTSSVAPFDLFRRSVPGTALERVFEIDGLAMFAQNIGKSFIGNL